MQDKNAVNVKNTQTQNAVVEVTRDDLPVHCPMDESQLWCSHPRVFIPLEGQDQSACSYCGTIYKLVDRPG